MCFTNCLGMQIDDGNKHILINFNNTYKEGKAVYLDQFPLTMEVKVECVPEKKTKWCTSKNKAA